MTDSKFKFIVSDCDGGDGGESLGSFESTDDAIQFFKELKDEFPDGNFDIAVEDEDGEWLEIFSANNAEEIKDFKDGVEMLLKEVY